MKNKSNFIDSDLITIVIARDDVCSLNILPTLQILEKFIQNKQIAQAYMERLSISFEGYDEDNRELYEIPEVRNFVYLLDEKFPFWLFFLSKKTSGLKCVMSCFLLPYLKEGFNDNSNRIKLGDLLTRRWFPALNHISTYAGLSERDLNKLTDRVVDYITE